MENVHKEKKIRIVEGEYNALIEKSKCADRYLESLKRLQAEFENAKKRMEKERQEFTRFSNESLMRALLPLIDSFEKAIATFTAGTEQDAHFDGIRLIYKQMFEILESEGLIRIKSVGQKFDPGIHEAIMEPESDEHSDGTVIEELRSGYMYHDKCLRPAIVKVAKKKITEDASEHKEN